MEKRIILNRIRCKHCEDIITSYYHHDSKRCSCGKVGVDGGHDYFRRLFPSGSPTDHYQDLSRETVFSTDMIRLRESIMPFLTGAIIGHVFSAFLTNAGLFSLLSNFCVIMAIFILISFMVILVLGNARRR